MLLGATAVGAAASPLKGPLSSERVASLGLRVTDVLLTSKDTCWLSNGRTVLLMKSSFSDVTNTTFSCRARTPASMHAWIAKQAFLLFAVHRYMMTLQCSSVKRTQVAEVWQCLLQYHAAEVATRSADLLISTGMLDEKDDIFCLCQRSGTNAVDLQKLACYVPCDSPEQVSRQPPPHSLCNKDTLDAPIQVSQISKVHLMARPPPATTASHSEPPIADLLAFNNVFTSSESWKTTLARISASENT